MAKRRTGRPKGAPPGARRNLTNGMRSAAMVENRRVFWALMKAAGEAIKGSREHGPASQNANSRLGISAGSIRDGLGLGLPLC